MECEVLAISSIEQNNTNYSMLDYSRYTANEFALDASFRKWVLRKTPTENIFWENWLIQHPEKYETTQQAKAIIFALRNVQEEIGEDEIAEAIAKIVDVAEQKNIKKVNFWQYATFRKLSLAASVLLVTLLSYVVFDKLSEKETPTYRNSVAKVAQKTKFIEIKNTSSTSQLITLSDGSSVVLQADSKLSYPEKFTGDTREVVLSGEAFFEIAKNPNQPFFVYANEVVAKVLGTSFTVKAFEDDKQVQVFVKTGKVSVYSQKNSALKEQQVSKVLTGLLVLPNQQATFIRPKWQFKRAELTVPQIVALPSIQRTDFVFKNKSVLEVFDTLENAYGIKIEYDKTLMASCELTAELGDEPLAEKIKLICEVLEAKYEMKDDKIVIEGKGCK